MLQRKRLTPCALSRSQLQGLISSPADSRTHSGLGHHWVKDRREIARNYLRGWFIIDLLSVVPALFDFLPLLTAAAECDSCIALRVVRILRLAKLVRIMRTGRLINRWETRLSINYGTISLVVCLIAVLCTAHLFACVIALITTFPESKQHTWLAAFGYCWIDEDWPSDDAASPVTAGAQDLPTMECVGGVELYVACFYWGVMVITGTGGTDMYHGKFSMAEQICVTSLILLGGLLWTYVLAVFCEVIANSRPEISEFRKPSRPAVTLALSLPLQRISSSCHDPEVWGHLRRRPQYG